MALDLPRASAGSAVARHGGPDLGVEDLDDLLGDLVEVAFVIAVAPRLGDDLPAPLQERGQARLHGGVHVTHGARVGHGQRDEVVAHEDGGDAADPEQLAGQRREALGLLGRGEGRGPPLQERARDRVLEGVGIGRELELHVDGHGVLRGAHDQIWRRT